MPKIEALAAELRRRVEDRISAWRIVVERIDETETSALAFAIRPMLEEPVD